MEAFVAGWLSSLGMFAFLSLVRVAAACPWACENCIKRDALRALESRVPIVMDTIDDDLTPARPTPLALLQKTRVHDITREANPTIVMEAPQFFDVDEVISFVDGPKNKRGG